MARPSRGEPPDEGGNQHALREALREWPVHPEASHLMREAISMHSAHLRSQGIEHRRAITPVREHPRLILASMGLVVDAPLRSLDRSLMPFVL